MREKLLLFYNLTFLIPNFKFKILYTRMYGIPT